MPTDRLNRVPTVLLGIVVPLVALVTVVVTLNATSDGTSAAVGDRSSSGTTIAIKNFQFSPNPIVVPVGTAVTVSNGDGTTHTLTADDKKFDTGQLDGGAKGSITIAAPGRYTYHCDIHNYMTGTLEAR